MRHWFWHKWEVRAVNSGTMPPEATEWGDYTEALYVCQCGAVRTEFLEGKWTLEDLKPFAAPEVER